MNSVMPVESISLFPFQWANKRPLGQWLKCSKTQHAGAVKQNGLHTWHCKAEIIPFLQMKKLRPSEVTYLEFCYIIRVLRFDGLCRYPSRFSWAQLFIFISTDLFYAYLGPGSIDENFGFLSIKACFQRCPYMNSLIEFYFPSP